MNAQDVQLVLDVQGILADNGVDAADITPTLISELIVWHNNSGGAPADTPAAPTPAPSPAKAKGGKPTDSGIPDDEPAF